MSWNVSRREVIGGAGAFIAALVIHDEVTSGDREKLLPTGSPKQMPDDYETQIVDTVDEAENYTPEKAVSYVFIWETQQTVRVEG